MRLHFVVDGDRDGVTIPRLVEHILGREFQETTRSWARLHGVSGYRRKLQYALRQALDSEADGIAAIVDEDRTGKERLKKLQKARNDERADKPPFPTALGVAIPFGEAWLLDDAEAVKAALQLPADASVPSTQQNKNPKAVLEQLLLESPRSGERPREVWADIAREVELDRCRHPQKTGFRAFAMEVEDELASIK